MALTVESLNQVSSGKNTRAATVFSYKTADTLAEVLAVGYFDDAQDGFENQAGRFRLADVILVTASDGTAFVQISVLTISIEVVVIAGGSSATIVFSGDHTWVGGTDSDVAAVLGVLATDTVIASIKAAPTEPAYLAVAAPVVDAIGFVLSAANTSNDAVISYLVLR